MHSSKLICTREQLLAIALRLISAELAKYKGVEFGNIEQHYLLQAGGLAYQASPEQINCISNQVFRHLPAAEKLVMRHSYHREPHEAFIRDD